MWLQQPFRNVKPVPIQDLFTSIFAPGDFSEWDTTVVSSGNTLDIVTSPVYEGTYAARAIRGVGGDVYAFFGKLNLWDKSWLYAETAIRIASGYSLTVNDEFVPLRIYRSDNSLRACAVIRYDGSDLVLGLFLYDLVTSAIRGSGDVAVLETDKWYKIQLYYAYPSFTPVPFGVDTQEARLFLDSVFMSRLTSNPTVPVETINILGGGFVEYHGITWQSSDTITMYFDRVKCSNLLIK